MEMLENSGSNVIISVLLKWIQTALSLRTDALKNKHQKLGTSSEDDTDEQDDLDAYLQIDDSEIENEEEHDEEEQEQEQEQD
jgi:hypothetical protein